MARGSAFRPRDLADSARLTISVSGRSGVLGSGLGGLRGSVPDRALAVGERIARAAALGRAGSGRAAFGRAFSASTGLVARSGARLAAFDLALGGFPSLALGLALSVGGSSRTPLRVLVFELGSLRSLFPRFAFRTLRGRMRFRALLGGARVPRFGGLFALPLARGAGLQRVALVRTIARGSQLEGFFRGRRRRFAVLFRASVRTKGGEENRREERSQEKLHEGLLLPRRLPYTAFVFEPSV